MQQPPASSLSAASASAAAAASATTTTSQASHNNLPKPSAGFRRFVLEAEQELRIEVSNSKGGASAAGGGGVSNKGGGRGPAPSAAGGGSTDRISLVVQKGSCEIFGYELALQRAYKFVTGGGGGGLSFPVYTFHGCVVDVGLGGAAENSDGTSDEGTDDLLSSRGVHAYVAERDDTAQSIAYVNTHAQLEALRDEALAAAMASSSAAVAAAASAATNPASAVAPTSAVTSSPPLGPRVLVLGGSESGKSTLVKTLVSYAVKLGRTPLWVDLDPGDNGIGLPGTIGVAVATRDSLTLSTLLHGGGGMPLGTSSPLALWHGSAVPQPDLMAAQVSALAHKIRRRLEAPDNDWERSSGLLVNAPAWLANDENWDVLACALRELRISVVLLTGHDKLYAKLRSLQQVQQAQDDAAASTDEAILDKGAVVVKVPRSGGIVSRSAQQMRQTRSRSIRRYFYGEDLVETSAVSGGGGTSLSSTNKGSGDPGAPAPASSTGPQPSLTPFLAQVKFDQLRLFRCTSMSLASSLLPLGATQTTEVVQLHPVPINEQITHHLLAVCHPHSVARYDETGSARDLYGAGVAGFVVVERVLVETEMLHLLAPCAGALPSHTLLMGDITWLD